MNPNSYYYLGKSSEKVLYICDDPQTGESVVKYENGTYGAVNPASLTPVR